MCPEYNSREVVSMTAPACTLPKRQDQKVGKRYKGKRELLGGEKRKKRLTPVDVERHLLLEG